MKAFSILEPYNCNLFDVADPIPEQNEAVLKLIHSGICGSDLNSYRGRNAYLTYPRIPGHEIAAEIISVPQNNRGLTPGMIVTCNPYFNCGQCYSCQRGLFNCCQNNQTMGVQRDGAMQDFITMPIDRIIDGKGLKSDLIALIEPFSIAYHGAQKARIKENDNVLVIGAGTIGVFSALSAIGFGANVFVSDIEEEKLNFVTKNFDISGTIQNDTDINFHEKVMHHTKGNGFDVVIEAAGSPASFQASIDAVAFGGTVILIGISNKTLDFNFTIIQKKELCIIGSRNATLNDFQQVISLFLKNPHWNIGKIISTKFPFQKAPEAFAFLDKHSSSLFKVMIDHKR